MSLLAPLYFIGALAISLPILFHLIRRRPKGQFEFSSLMFLRPSPPRLTRRSRLDNWLLLLIRALALLLIAAAFTRPFLRSRTLSDAELPGRRLVLLIDTSASMQRAGMWQQALDQADKLIEDLQAADRLAIIAFDSQPRTVIGFDELDRLSLPQRKSTATKRLRELSPTWQATDLGEALSYAGDLAAAYEPDDPTNVNLEDETGDEPAVSVTGPAQLVLISDMQVGADLESLQVYAWPDELRLDVQRIASAGRTNASVSLLPDVVVEDADEAKPNPGQNQDRVRVRVTNSGDATESRFELGWAFADVEPNGPRGNRGPGSTANDETFPVQVPPGQTRIVRMPRPAAGMNALKISGDDHSFDNMYYVVAPEARKLELLYVGADAAEPRASLAYYLKRVPLDNPWRTVDINQVAASELPSTLSAKQTPLVVLTVPLDDAATEQLQQYVSSGGQLLVVLATPDQQEQIDWLPMARTVNQLADSQLEFGEANVDDYAMFSQIDFTHRFFEPMADPKFNDFTQIRFWNHRAIDGVDDGWRRAAAFDNGQPAIIEKSVEQGSVAVLATGWQPLNSQLAMSTKFIPLVFSWFRSPAGEAPLTEYEVGDPLVMEPASTATLTLFSGTTVPFQDADDGRLVDQPGIYQYRNGDETIDFAVNLSRAESDTTAIDEGQLERFGAVLGDVVETQQARQRQRQLRDQELESEQRLWQWLLVAALALLGLETALGRRQSRRRSTPATGNDAALETPVGTQV